VGRVTLQTVADKVGVSRMTVSNAFSRPDQLSATLRAKILAAAQELGYAGPDPAARALARGSTGAVGVLLTSSLTYAFSDDVAIRFFGAIAQELADTGLALTLLSAESRNEVVPTRDVAMDGAIVYSCTPATESLQWLQKRDLPLVYVDQDPVEDVPSINVDDRAGARSAAEHLLSLGHRRIAVMMLGTDGQHGFVPDLTATAATWTRTSRERAYGFLDALTPAGVEPITHRQRDNSAEDARAAARLLLSGEHRPTGVLCYSDVLARGVLMAAEDLGLRVPDDVSVTGFDDSAVAMTSRPQLTTVRQDVRLKGKAAATALIAAMQSRRDGTSAEPPHHVFPTELVVRDSTGPVAEPV
jgi:DNA-binding LacI/PurR family transcriptional regulator